MLVPAPLSPPPIAVRAGGPAITLEQAQRTAPAALADALLAPGHPPVVEVDTSVPALQAPPMPGMAVSSEVRLLTAALHNPRTGFCEKTSIAVALAPVRGRDGVLPPAPARSLTTSTLYRWPESTKDGPRCEAASRDFFRDLPGTGPLIFTAIRALATLKPAQIRRIRLSVEDPFARGMRNYVRRKPEEAARVAMDEVTPITDAHVALARFPISAISLAERYEGQWGQALLKKADLHDARGRPLDAVFLSAANRWNVAVVLDGDRITTIRLRRQIEPVA